MRALILAVAFLLTCLAAPVASAAELPLFADGFESGGLDPARWSYSLRFSVEPGRYSCGAFTGAPPEGLYGLYSSTWEGLWASARGGPIDVGVVGNVTFRLSFDWARCPDQSPILHVWSQGGAGSSGSSLSFPQHASTAAQVVDYSHAVDGNVTISFSTQSGLVLDRVALVATSAVAGYPRALVATTGPGMGEISLTWQPPAWDGGSPITSYQVHRATAASGPFELVGNAGLAHEYVDRGLPHGATRHYKITAANSNGQGGTNVVVAATTYGPPGSPTGLQVMPGPGAGELSLSWGAPIAGGPGVSEYRIYRGSSAGGETLIATVGSGSSYVDRGLPANQTRSYRVSAVNAAGEGPRSAPVGGTTFSWPGPPVGLAADPGPARGEISLSWQPPTWDGGMPVTRYRVYRSGVEIATPSTPSYVDAGIADRAPRTYEVRAETAVGVGDAASVTAQAPQPPGAPIEVRTEPGPALGALTLFWMAPSDDGGRPLTGYGVWRSTSPDPAVATLRARAAAPASSFLDEGLDAGSTYHYWLRATNEFGDGALSAGASGVPAGPPGAPRNLHADETSPLLGTALSWDPPAGSGGPPIEGYRVYHATTWDGNYSLHATTTDTQHLDGTSWMAAGNTSYYLVTAFTSAGEGPPSNIASPYVLEAGGASFTRPNGTTPDPLPDEIVVGPLVVNETCRLSACREGVAVSGRELHPGLDAPAVTIATRRCIDPQTCIGGENVTIDPEPTGAIGVPGQSVPGACAAVATPCERVELVPRTAVAPPVRPPRAPTPSVNATVGAGETRVASESQGERIAPVTIDRPGLVERCTPRQPPCPPTPAPAASAEGQIRVAADVDGEGVGASVPWRVSSRDVTGAQP